MDQTPMLDSFDWIVRFVDLSLADRLLLAADTPMLERWGNNLYYIALVVLGLGFVIFVHELGHFLAAKAFGVKCEKFYVGFDVPIKIGPIRLPSKLAKFQWGETEYGIGIIPLGGYVKMLGQDDDPRRLKEEAERIRSEDPNATADDPLRSRLDPRSYPAKPVFARMIIISAGVVMNLIFGVLMAAFAFSLGVPYDPAVIGEVIPGDPAWVQGIRSGDKIVQVASVRDEQLSFNDMRQKIALAGIRDAKQPVPVAFERDGIRNDVEIVGTTVHWPADAKIKLLTLGIRAASTTQLSSKYAFDRFVQFSGQKLGDFQPGDVIVGIDGEMLPLDPASDIPFGYELEKRLHPKLDSAVTLQVRRKRDEQTEQVDVSLAPMPLKSFGLRFGASEVTAIAENSLAAKAGIQVGDRPTRFNGQPIEDALVLPMMVAGLAGQSVTLELERDGAEPQTLQWQVPEMFQMVHTISMFAPAGFELPGSGLVYKISNTVLSVDPDSTAAKNGLKAGDVIKQIQFVPRTEAQKEYYAEVFDSKTLLEKMPVDSIHSIQFFFELTQWMSIGMPVSIYYERDGKVDSSETTVQFIEGRHWPDRGLTLQPFKKSYRSESIVQSLTLGVGEIWRRLGDVWEFLILLIQGKAFNAIGGPGTIAVQATDAASRGISPLLMFLTLLSANLAIINFLPIPALDGGHMVFLITEAILGKPVDEELQMKLTMGGVVGLLCLMGWAIFNDYIHLSRYFGG